VLDFVDGRALRLENDQHGPLGIDGNFKLHSVVLLRDGLSSNCRTSRSLHLPIWQTASALSRVNRIVLPS